MADIALATEIAKRFIARKDVKAQQTADGAWHPVTVSFKDQTRVPWQMADISAHLDGAATFGHYMLNTDDTCKLFAFDVDLIEGGSWVQTPDNPMSLTNEQFEEQLVVHEYNARATWMDRSPGAADHPSRPFAKRQMRELANGLARSTSKLLDIPVAMAYSGSKGIHVYGFTGPVPASDAFDAAKIVLDSIGEWEPLRGKAFFRHRDQDPKTGYPSFSLEVFPKQESLGGKDLGNLMRLILGRNQKTGDPGFLIDSHAPFNVLAPHPDPLALLRSGDAWL